MRITVTADHIARGTRTACMHCPVALAYGEQTGHLCSVTVLPATIKDLVTHRIYPLPGWVGALIEQHDAEGTMEPFSFDL